MAEKMPSDAFITVEVSSFQLETILNFRPKISAVLNMTEDHLNRHKTMEAYIAAKERIFENQGADDYCILNYDNEITRNMAVKTKAQVVFFSHNVLESGVFVQDDAIWIKLNNIDEGLIKINNLPIPGTHNLENAMAAAAISAAAGVPPAVISQGLRNFKAVEHRLEFVRNLNGVDYYNDSKATNTDSAIKGLSAMKNSAVLIGGGQDKGLDFNEWVGMFAGNVRNFIVIGEVTQKLVKTCKNQGFANYHIASDMSKAVQLASSLAKKGDCVLLSPACASFDMFDSFEHRGRMFKEYVNQL